MTALAVVIPTITGRETLLEATMAAYRAWPAAVERWSFILVRDRTTIGAAWEAGAQMARAEGYDYIHLSADDVEPLPGALDEGLRAAVDGILASPRIIQPDGTLLQCGSLGGGQLLGECADGTVASTSQFPILSASSYSAIAPIPAIHYYADDYVGWALRQEGFAVEVRTAFAFRHLGGSAGRAAAASRAVADRDTFLTTIATRRSGEPVLGVAS